jgi:hypothetical protein
MKIKIGDTILIPAGASVFETWQHHTPTITKRKSTARVINLHDYAIGDDWMRFLTENEESALHDFCRQCGVGYSYPYFNFYRDSPQTARAREMLNGFKTRIFSEYNNNLLFVEWGERAAHVDQVSIVEAVANKPVREKTVTKRVQMVRGSVWKMTESVSVTGIVSRRGYNAHNNTSLPGLPGQDDLVIVPQFDIPKGFQFTVVNKLRSLGHGDGLGIPIGEARDGIIFHYKNAPFHLTPFEWNGLHLPYAQIEKFVENVSIPEDTRYVLRDKQNGEYFAGFEYDDKLRMSKTFKSAKKYDSVANVKSSIRSWTGMLAGRGSEIEMAGGHANIASEKKIDLPATWEIIPIDSVTLEEKTPIDIQTWYNEASK